MIDCPLIAPTTSDESLRPSRRVSPSKKAIEAEIQKVREEFCAKYFPKPTKSLEQLLDE